MASDVVTGPTALTRRQKPRRFQPNGWGRRERTKGGGRTLASPTSTRWCCVLRLAQRSERHAEARQFHPRSARV